MKKTNFNRKLKEGMKIIFLPTTLDEQLKIEGIIKSVKKKREYDIIEILDKNKKIKKIKSCDGLFVIVNSF